MGCVRIMGLLRNKFPGKYSNAFAFVLIYCWYNIYWRRFELGPVAAALGQMAGTAKTLVSLAAIAGVTASLVLPWSHFFERKKIIKATLHILAFVPYYVVQFFTAGGVVVTLCLIGGFAVGGLVGRALYTMFFELMDVHPTKVTVVGYIIIQIYIHINDIVLPIAGAPLYYFLSAATLLVGLMFSFIRNDGDEMELRRILPENRFHVADVWQLLLIITLLQTCMTLYDYVLLQKTIWRGPAGEALNIIPDVIMFIVLSLYGKRFKLTGMAVAFLALFSCTTVIFLVFGTDTRIMIQLFMEPAYRIADLLFIWVLNIVFYTYGRRQFQLKACLAVFFAVRFGTHVGFEALFSAVEPFREAAFMTLLPAFFAALLLPATERSLKSMEARRVYAEERQEREVQLPPEREEVAASCADLERLLTEGTRLTDNERIALCYLIDGQDNDVTAYFMEIRVRRLREINDSLYEKFEVRSASELMVILGKAQMESTERRKRDDIFTRHGLTEREREIALLLLSAEPAKNISGILGISRGTVNFHSNNLYRKCSIQSRAELVALFAAAAAGGFNGEN